MSERVDQLFAGEPPPPPIDAAARITTLRRTLGIAIALDVLGIPCWTSVPGAVLTLWVWMGTEADRARIVNGEYLEEDAAAIMALRRWASLALVFCVLSMLLQIFLLSTSFYERLWGSITVALRHMANGLF